MKKLIRTISNFFFNLFASPKAKTNKVLAKGNKRLVQVLVEKNTRKKEMIAWLRKASNNGKQYNLHHQIMLLDKKFGPEMQERGIKITTKGNAIQLTDARA